MALALSEADFLALITLLRETIAADASPMSPRVRALKDVLEKLEAPAPAPEPFQRPSDEKSDVLSEMRRP